MHYKALTCRRSAPCPCGGWRLRGKVAVSGSWTVDEPSVAVNWAVHPVLGRQNSPASLSCSPWLTSEEEHEMVENKHVRSSILMRIERSRFVFTVDHIHLTWFWYHLLYPRLNKKPCSNMLIVAVLFLILLLYVFIFNHILTGATQTGIQYMCVCEKSKNWKQRHNVRKNREWGKETESGSFEEAVYQRLALLVVLKASHLHDL